MFTLAISCLTTPNLPWFMDLTFQVFMQYCSLQHQTLLLSPIPSTTGCYFCFGSVPSFYLKLFLHWSPVAYLAPAHLGNSSFSVLSFCLCILFTGFSMEEYWSGLPLPSAVDHILSGEDWNILNLGYLYYIQSLDQVYEFWSQERGLAWRHRFGNHLLLIETGRDEVGPRDQIMKKK